MEEAAAIVSESLLLFRYGSRYWSGGRLVSGLFEPLISIAGISDQDAFADPVCTHHNLRELKLIAKGVDDQRTGQEDACAFGFDLIALCDLRSGECGQQAFAAHQIVGCQVVLRWIEAKV